MRCFAHNNEEAIGVCGICGKAMCVNCSAYSGHSGVCPVCRLKEYETEYAKNKSIITKYTLIAVLIAIISIAIATLGAIYLGVNFLWCFIGIVFSGIPVLKMLPTIKRNRYLIGEITKIRTFLQRGNAQI